MNPGITNNHPAIYYYDSDYPSPYDTLFPENFDAVTEFQGLAFDIERYLQLAGESGNPVLELCCGTGRVAIPLARAGFQVTGIDLNEAMLQKFRESVENEEMDVRRKVTVLCQDIVKLDLGESRYALIILAFNSLLCIPDFDQQCEALGAIAKHLKNSGRLILDIVNPLRLKLDGDPVPKPFFTRKDRNTGNAYTRFAMMGPVESDGRQQLHGWYDQITPEGNVKRQLYSLYWRPIFRFEIELMLREAGLRILQIEGGHRQEPYTAQSPRMFLIAGK